MSVGEALQKRHVRYPLMAFGVIASLGAPILMAYHLLTRDAEPARVYGGAAEGVNPEIAGYTITLPTLPALPDPQTPIELALYLGGGTVVFLAYGAFVILVLFRFVGDEHLLYH